MDAASAKEKFDAGARLIQIYSGFIYCGPRLIREIDPANAKLYLALFLKCLTEIDHPDPWPFLPTRRRLHVLRDG